MDFLRFPTPLGEMGLTSEGGALLRLYLPGEPVPLMAPHETPLLLAGQRQLLEYCGGTRQVFDLPLRAEGTPFRQRVWAALLQIPYGSTCSYGDLARAIGKPKAFRAVGGANHANPLPIFIPCHRVISTGGGLGGYGGGTALKQNLLNLEGHH